MSKISLVKSIIPLLAPVVLEEATKYCSIDHGSKVKEGKYKNCPIELFADKACIVVKQNSDEILLLTKENIQTFRFIKKKFRMNAMENYYYYEVTWSDGSQSYVRMRQKYLDAVIKWI